jgi:hypothetical protein
MVSGQRRVVLDTSFVTRESRDGRHLRMLAKMGCTLVMADSLSYECCTSGEADRWLHVQRKLMTCPDAVEVWRHSGELLRDEVGSNAPTADPADGELTCRTREWFRSGRTYVPPDLASLAAPNRQQREVDTVQALLSDCERLKSSVDTLAGQVWNRKHDATYQVCYNFVNDPTNIRAALRRNHGNPDDPETHIPDASDRVGPGWLAYHHAKGGLALLCLYVHKYGSRRTPDRVAEIENTSIDADYLTLLGFADGLATDETTGELERLFRWMYGDSKKFITIPALDALAVPEVEVRTAAYYRWCEGGRRHGNEVEDWLDAEGALHAPLWDRL